MNLIDLAVVMVIGFFIFYGYRKGLILTVFKFVSFFASVALARYLYPYVSRMLRGTPLYAALKNIAADTLGFGSMFRISADSPAAGISALPIPDMLKDMLAENNTPDIYSLLRVETVEEYVTGFIANIIVNVISMVLVFALAWAILSIVGHALAVIGKLPVINTLNRAGGLAVGILMGVCVAWAGLTLVGVLFATPAYPEVFAYMQGSLAVNWFFDSGFVMEMLTGL